DGRYDADFKTFDQDLPGRGFMTNAMWLRLTVRHDGPNKEIIYFSSRYPILDTVQLFQKNEAGSWQSERRGDLNPERTGRAPYRTPILKMHVTPGINTYYIKLQTQGSIVLAIYLAKPDAMRRFQMLDSAAIALFFGMLLTLLFYNGFLTFSFRSVTYFYYFLFILNMIFTQAALQGLWPVILPGALGTWASNTGFLIFAAVAYATAFMVTTSFLNMREHMPVFHKIFSGVAIFCAIMVPLAFVLPYNIHVKILSMILFIGSFIMLGCSVLAVTRGYRPAFAWCFAWLFMLVNNIMLGLTYEGIIHMPFIVQFSNLPGVACEGILMSLALADRVNFFRAKADRTIHELNDQLQQHLVQVEALVAERTETIRTILDHVASGFLMIDRNASIAPGFTRSCLSLLASDLQEGQNLLEVLALKPDLTQKFSMALNQVFDDQMPLEASLGQLPSYVLAHGKYLHMEAAGVRDKDGRLQHILLTWTDATELRRRRLEAQRNRSLLKTLRDIEGFRQFVAYSFDAVQKLKQLEGNATDQGSREVQFILHTLKGNCMVFQLPEIARFLHQLEEKAQIRRSDLDKLEEQFKKYLTRHASLLRTQWGPISYEKRVTDAQLNALRELSRTRFAPPLRVDIDHWIQDVSAKPVRSLLHSMMNDARVVARKLHKNVEMRVLDRDARVHSEAEEALIDQLIHVVRNAIVHGIEDDREAVNKAQQGFICLDFRELPDGLAISCSDDGRGFDRQVWEEEWKARGLPLDEDITRMSLAQLVSTISRGGFSTQSKVSLFAGRGIGMEALFAAVERCQGTLDIISEPGKGARFEIFIPRSQSLRSVS
ncbi:MAG TPA: 7TM diverse intracellular signaling domain-containing protein, partial [Oligoflexus sp.]|uniref:7TM diverse intracellular signaling domain-containing protein n=1 Tax=Oligoflexus sp. TaxID=1971216 RepID=UPI002D7E98A3